MKFVFDLDGTICFKGKPVTEKILSALEALQSNGHQVIFASARPIRDMLPVLHERFHTHTMIGGNGSLVSQQGQLTHAHAFSEDQINTITSLIQEFEATYLIDGEWDYSYTGPSDHPILNNVDPAKLAKMVDIHQHPSIVKVLILTANRMGELAERLSDLDVVVHRHKSENVLDMSPNDIHKWGALSKIGIEQGRYIAFGNDANDISMFMHASHSVMIGHHDELANHASESISLGDDVEDKIIEKLKYLAALEAE